MRDVTLVTIGEAAKLLEVTATTLRNWDKNGKLKPVRSKHNKYRLYSINEIKKLRMDKESLNPLTELPQDIKTENINNDHVRLRQVLRKASKAFRDSEGGSLIKRLEDISTILFCKLYDEQRVKKGKKPVFTFTGRDSDKEIADKLNSLYTEAVSMLGVDNNNVTLTSDVQALAETAKLLQDITIADIPTDAKGILYEELIRNTFDKNENQQFFTPRTIVDFMVELSGISKGQVILDPASGSGGFLIQASKYAKENKVKNLKLIGLEIDSLVAWIAQLNLLVSESAGIIHHLNNGGSLGFSVKVTNLISANSIDLIITNPPFGSDYSNLEDLRKYELGKGKTNRRRGVLFIERCIKWIKPGGKLAIIIDDSVLNGANNKDVREFMLNNTHLRAVISLPDVAFKPYASVKASILFLEKSKKKSSKNYKVFMASAKNVGRKANGDPYYENGMLVNDLPDILKQWKNFIKTEKLDEKDGSDHIYLTSFRDIVNADNKLLRLDTLFNSILRTETEKYINSSKHKLVNLNELVNVRNIFIIPAINDPDEFYRYIGLANISSKDASYQPIEVSGSSLKSAVKKYEPGDILFSKLRPELQKVIKIDERDQPGYTSSECIVLVVSPQSSLELLPDYLFYFLRTKFALGQLIYGITGVGRPRINISSLLSIKVPMPSLSEQKKILSTVRERENRYLRYKKRSELELKRAEEVKKSIDERVASLIF